MRTLLLILFLSLAYVGCAGRPVVTPGSAPTEPKPVPPPASDSVGPDATVDTPSPEEFVPPPEPTVGHEIRVLVTDDATTLAVVRSNSGLGLSEDSLLLSWTAPKGESTCWTFWLNDDYQYPNGDAVQPGDFIEQWERSLTNGTDADSSWLLETIGIVPDGTGGLRGVKWDPEHSQPVLEMCPSRSAPDLRLRIAHPALWLVESDRGGGHGPGPFERQPDGALLPNPRYPGPGPYVERIDWLRIEGDPTLPLRLGDCDVAVLFGSGVRELIETSVSQEIELRPLPAWDRTYFLWLDPDKRWLNDPEFRSWVAGVVDRDKMLEYLFDDQGERAFSLSRDGSAVPRYGSRPDRPLDENSIPRLDLSFDAADPLAQTIARRFQAVLATHDVELSLSAAEPAALRSSLIRGEIEMAVLSHHPATPDAMLGLLETVWWLGPGADAEREALVSSCSEIPPGDPEGRRVGAWAIEDALLMDGRVVPLIRLDAWLARNPKLAGVGSGVNGELHLDSAWWLP